MRNYLERIFFIYYAFKEFQGTYCVELLANQMFRKKK